MTDEAKTLTLRWGLDFIKLSGMSCGTGPEWMWGTNLHGAKLRVYKQGPSWYASYEILNRYPSGRVVVQSEPDAQAALNELHFKLYNDWLALGKVIGQ